MKSKTTHQKKPKRIGRGTGSGYGKTCGKGHKGQKSRSGYSQRRGFEGGQNPLYRRLPKRGFSRGRFDEALSVVNLDQIASAGEVEVTPEVLKSKGVVKKQPTGIKVLGRGELTSAVTVKAHAFSESAKAKIEASGGTVVLIGVQNKDNA